MAESPTVAEYVRRAKQGDDEAYRLLIDAHTDALRGFVINNLPPALRRKVSVTDVLQETYWAGYQSIARFEDRGEGAFLAWITKIAEHKLRDVLRHYRSRKRAAYLEVGVEQRPATQDAPAGYASPSEEFAARELAERIREGLMQLTSLQRLVLHMVRVEGVPMAEIGRRMGRSTVAVQKTYERAKARLWAICFDDEEAGGASD